jgi:hypothetical protein
VEGEMARQFAEGSWAAPSSSASSAAAAAWEGSPSKAAARGLSQGLLTNASSPVFDAAASPGSTPTGSSGGGGTSSQGGVSKKLEASLLEAHAQAPLCRPKVGVGIFVLSPQAHPGCVLLGKRIGSDGAGASASVNLRADECTAEIHTAVHACLAEVLSLSLSLRRACLLPRAVGRPRVQARGRCPAATSRVASPSRTPRHASCTRCAVTLFPHPPTHFTTHWRGRDKSRPEWDLDQIQ